MKPAAFILLVSTPFISIAQESHSANIPEHYAKFQGEWVVVSQSGSSGSGETPPKILVEVTGKQFTLRGFGVTEDLPQPLEFRVPKSKADNPYRELQKRGAQELDTIVDVDNQIVVFWFVGIYKLTDDELHLALKYCGQGLVGPHFRDFRPPSSFDEERMDDEVRLILKRKNN
jgi:hypothetical protein